MSSKTNAKQKSEKDPKSCTKNEKNSTPDYKEKFTKCKKDLDGANEKIAKLNKDLELNQFELWSIKKNFNYEEVRKKLPQMMDNDGIFAETQARLENEVATLQREIVTYKSQQGIQTDGKAKDKLDEDKGKLEKEVVLSDGKDIEELKKDKEELEQARRTIENHDKNMGELEKKIKALGDENEVLKDRPEGKPDSKLEKVNEQLSDELRAAKDQGLKLEEENKQLNKKLSDAKDKWGELEKKIKALGDENEVLKDRPEGKPDSKLEKVNEQLSDELRAAKDQGSKLEEENKQLNKKLSDAKDKWGELEKKIKALGDENEVLKDRPEGKPDSKLEKVNEQLSDELRAAKDQGSKLEEENKQLNKKLSDAKDKCSNLEKENEQLKGKLLATKDQGNTSKSDSKTELEKLNRRINEKEQELNETKDTYQTRLKEKEGTIKQNKDEIVELKMQVEKLQKELDEQKQAIQKMKDAHPKSGHSRQRELEKEITVLKQRLKDDQQRSGNSRESELLEEVESLKTRLSKMAGAQLMDGNPNIADLSDTNRPTKLAEQYSELYDNQWTDAFEILEKKGKTEPDIIKTLHSILMDTYKFCIEVSQEQMRQIKHALTAVTKNGEEIPDENIPVVKRRQLHDLRKTFAPDLIDIVFESFKKKKSPKDIENTGMKSYVHKCIALCWLMNVQDPPVVLDTKNHSGPFNGDVFRTYTKIGKTLDFVVWPALYIQQGGAMLAKGVAQGK